MKKTASFATLAFICALNGCSRQDAGAIATSVATTYNASYKDNVVNKWQAKVAGGGRCQEFRDRFKAAGERYNDAANGAFAMDMMKIWDSAKAAQCGLAA